MLLNVKVPFTSDSGYFVHAQLALIREDLQPITAAGWYYAKPPPEADDLSLHNLISMLSARATNRNRQIFSLAHLHNLNKNVSRSFEL